MNAANRLIVVMFLLAASIAQAQPQQTPRRGGGGGRFGGNRDDAAITFRANPAMLAAFKSVVADASHSTVRLLCDDKEAALGTIVSDDGFILTKYSELSGAITARLKDNRAFVATIVGVDSKFDLAMLRIDAKNLKPIEWRDSKTAVVGNFIASVSNTDQPVAVGVVSVASRSVKMRDQGQPPAPANSGFLGVGLDEAEGGAMIMSVSENSAAAKAGLKVNDIVTLIQDTSIIDSETMINTIQHYRPGDQVTIKFKRNEKEMEVRATLGNRPPVDPRIDRRDFQNSLGGALSTRRTGFPQILQHDTVLKPSDCGGPLVDLDGKAVGLNIARAGRVESYALLAEDVQALIPQLKSGKLAPPPATKPTTKPVVNSIPTTAPATRPAKK